MLYVSNYVSFDVTNRILNLNKQMFQHKTGLVDIQKTLLKPKVQMTKMPTMFSLQLKPNIHIMDMRMIKHQILLKNM